MSYTWTNGETITANKLNNTGGDGIFVVTQTQSGDNYVLDKTYNEVLAAWNSGMLPVVVYNNSDCILLYVVEYIGFNENSLYEVFADGNSFTSSSADGVLTSVGSK